MAQHTGVRIPAGGAEDCKDLVHPNGRGAPGGFVCRSGHGLEHQSRVQRSPDRGCRGRDSAPGGRRLPPVRCGRRTTGTWCAFPHRRPDESRSATLSGTVSRKLKGVNGFSETTRAAGRSAVQLLDFHRINLLHGSVELYDHDSAVIASAPGLLERFIDDLYDSFGGGIMVSV